MNDLLVAGRREMNPEARREIYLRAHRVWEKDLPFLPLFSLYYYVGAAKHIKLPEKPVSKTTAGSDFFADLRGWSRRANQE